MTEETNVEFTAKLEYNCNVESQVWHFNSCHNPIAIDSNRVMGSEDLLRVMHGALPCLLVDSHHICDRVTYNSTSYHTCEPSTVVSLLSFVRSNGLLHHHRIHARGVPLVKRELYSDVSEDIRRFFRSMIRFVIHLHKHGISLCKLDVNKNFAVVDKKLKFRDIRFIVGTPETKENDFKLLSSVIAALFQKNKFALPNDIQHLIGVLNNNSNSETLLENHLSVLTVGDRLTLIRSFHEKLGYISEPHLDICLNCINSVELDDNWHRQLLSGDLKFGAVINCFAYLQSSPRNDSHLNRIFVRFCRHLVVHLIDHLPKHMPKSNAPHETKPTENDTDRTIMAFYGAMLLDIQMNLDNNDVLQFFVEKNI